MTSLPTAYTPLETLLLFQGLRSEGVNSTAVFNRISDQLLSVPLIRSHPTFDSGRLSPDALRELHLWLLKEEAKSDLKRQSDREDKLRNGSLSPTSRKRKAPTPDLPTVSAAGKHADLIPQLVTRLYARYREYTSREIKEHERRYEALSREIKDIEAGRSTGDVSTQRTVSATQSPHPVSSAKHSASTGPRESTQDASAEISGGLPSNGQVDGDLAKPYTRNKIDALINHDGDARNGAGEHRGSSSSNTKLPPLHIMAPQSPRFGIPPTIPPSVNQMYTEGYSQSPSNNQNSPFTPHHAHPMQASLSRPSSSPRTLPPPPGMHFPPPPHGQQANLHGSMTGQHYYDQPPHSRMPTGPSPSNERPQLGYLPPQQPPGPVYYQQQQPYLERRTSYPPFSHQQSPAGYSTQSFHGGAYQQQPPLPSQSPQHTQGPPTYPQHPATAPSTAPRPSRPPNNRLLTDIVAALATPPRIATPPREVRTPVWKSERRPGAIEVGTPLPAPEPEAMSPTINRSEPPARSTRSARHRGAVSEKPGELEALPIPRRARAKSKRDRSPLSAVSSTADESRMTRSQSVSTTAGALAASSEERPGSRGNVKAEPSTPAGFPDDIDTTQEVPSGGRVTRKRRSTLQTLSQPPQKRKRQHSIAGVGDHELDDPGTPPPRSNTVVATRNFHKLSSTIMNDINSHKHASYFANMVRDKDAPGYSEIIKRPQHLKSIRAAISAGNRAINAAAATLDSPSIAETPTTSASKNAPADGATVELERTEDLIPPKGIVNGAQLEKEVLRMFANAVMFNPGEDGMVSDTREMFEDVDAKMQEWRGAEKEAADVEEDESKVKRRKL